MDQVIKVIKHLSFEGIHHEVHLFLHRLHLCDYLRWSRICDGWTARVLSFGLLGALLPFGSSWSFLSALVPFWSSFWVLCLAFFWCSYFSRSWFCLVRRFTVTARVWTCLSRVVVRGSSPWTLLVIAIERVSTMQLFVWEAIVWLTSYKVPTDGVN